MAGNHKITASEISYCSYPEKRVKYSQRPKGMPSAVKIHKLLGYDNNIKFVRDYKATDGQKYSVRGKPDKLEGNTVIELKTFWGEDYKHIQEGRGEVQLQTYLWLTEEPFGELHIYDINSCMLEEIPMEFEKDLFVDSIERLIWKN